MRRKQSEFGAFAGAMEKTVREVVTENRKTAAQMQSLVEQAGKNQEQFILNCSETLSKSTETLDSTIEKLRRKLRSLSAVTKLTVGRAAGGSAHADGAFKWNREYKRAPRRGLKGVNFELALISCGFNLHKYHLKKQAQQLAA